MSSIQLRYYGSFALLFSSIAVICTVVLYNYRTAKQIIDDLPPDYVFQLPLSFEPNQGQASEPVRFLSRGNGYAIFLTPEEMVLTLRKPASGSEGVLRMRLKGGASPSEITGLNPQSGKSNYFIGSDAQKWRADIPHFGRVHYENVYPGIDQVFYGKGRQLEYDFVVTPGADASQVELKFEGADSIEIDQMGDLVLSLGDSEVRQERPVIYQEVDGEKRFVTGNYVLNPENTVGFEIAEYDREKTLVIDPVLVYSTYLGGNSADIGRAIAVDPARNVYVTGQTRSTNFPLVNPIQSTINNPGSPDFFVTKINSEGNAIVYSTFIGGSVGDIGHGIDVDNAGNAYVTGVTGGTSGPNDFPTTPGAFDRTFNSPDEAVLFKINAAGNVLVYSTYTGASNSLEVKVNRITGEAFIAGFAGENLPTTPGAFRTTCMPTPCFANGFITKFNATGSALVYSTYIGPGVVNDLAIDSVGNAYVAGSTVSLVFPITPGAAQTTCTGCEFFRSDAFVLKMNPTGSALVYSTYLGGSLDDVGAGIAVDANGNAYVTGRTSSPSTTSLPFPTTPGAFQTTSPGIPDGFVTKVNPTGSAFVYSTFVGGNVRDEAFGIAVDPAGRAHIIGETRSNNYPRQDAVQSVCTVNGQCVSITSLNAAGSAVIFSTYFGQGAGWEIVADNRGSIYVTGEAIEGLSNLPTMNPIQPNHGSGSSVFDGFVAKIFVQAVSTTSFDYDGDGQADISVFRPSNGFWHLLRSQAGYTGVGFGLGSDLTAPADIDGDGKTDVAVFRPSNGTWYWLNSSNGVFSFAQFGTSGDLPMPGDFDGDGRADLSVFRPSAGTWYRLNSSNGQFVAIQFGQNGDKPVMGDFDGDGKSDVAVFRLSSGTWYILNSSNGQFVATGFGLSEDKPTAADYDGDAKTDISVYRPSTGVWYRINSSNGSFAAVSFGTPEDKPAAADFDGDGKADVAVFRPSSGTWYLMRSTAGFAAAPFGTSEDIPTPNAFVY